MPERMVPTLLEPPSHAVLDTKQLHTFCVVARTCNFTRAAKELGCCQSTVTVHIRSLELAFGALLFDRNRSSKAVMLTKAGKCALDYAQRLLALVDEAKAVLSQSSAVLE
ncbi:MAG TPA: LysR family transcriptional regulator [Bryobacteraceae bacterium]|jgi:DNA-binding transcriptional LysR family regulator